MATAGFPANATNVIKERNGTDVRDARNVKHVSIASASQ